MTSEIICTNTFSLKEQLQLKQAKANEAARNIVVRGSKVIANTAKEQFREKNPDVTAAPPQAPNPTSRTGELRRSIRMLSVSSLGAGRWQSTTGTKIAYARPVEYGHGSTGNAFPFMRSGFEGAKGVGNWSELKDIYREEWAKALE
jgi:hypothetical protein